MVHNNNNFIYLAQSKVTKYLVETGTGIKYPTIKIRIMIIKTDNTCLEIKGGGGSIN